MPIRKLSQDVINKIAAGEVVQRPANAIKELIENSIDAGAKTIKVKTKKGGLEMFQIEDDGCGIPMEDLPLAGVRFATSKLQEYTDLKDIGSFGFRGEALASISHVGHLTITSKPVAQEVAYKIQFDGGKPNVEAIPSAGRNGTVIHVKDLFHNMGMRQKSYNANEEQFKIAEVIRAYSIHYENLNFSLFRIDKSQTQVRSWNLPDRKTIIQHTYSKEVSSNILTTKLSDEEIGVKGEIFFTSSGYSGKKFILLIFVNNRLIESKQIKQIMETVYEEYLPKGARPWVYLNLSMPGKNIDVNVHPTKMEVQFLHDERIYEMIKKKMDMFLIPTKEDRTMTVVPTFLSNHETSVIDLNESRNSRRSDPNSSDYQHQMVRNDSSSQRIDSFLATIDAIRGNNKENEPRQPKSSTPKKENETASPISENKKSLKRKFEKNETINGRAKRNRCQLTSMLELEKEIEGNVDLDFKSFLENCIFVGFASSSNILVQHQENLLSVDFSHLSEDLFYQIIVKDYGNFDVDELEDPIDLPAILQISSIDPLKWERLLHSLKIMREMLLDYFGIQIDEDLYLRGMPKIIDDYRPEFNKIYKFFEYLQDTNWKHEGKCLKSVSKALAKFYSFAHYEQDELDYLKEVMENTIFPIYKSDFFLPQLCDDFSEPVMLTSLPALYKVFERC